VDGVQDEVPQELIEAEQAQIKEALSQLQDFAVDGESVGGEGTGGLGGGDLPGLSEEQLSEGQEVILPKASDRCRPLPSSWAHQVAFGAARTSVGSKSPQRI
jgi:hypothetical protein